MNRNGDLFRKLLDDLRRQVSESFAPGDHLPSKRDFAVMYGVSPTTIHRALLSLNKDGVIRSAARVGWFRVGCERSGNQSPHSSAPLRVAILSRRARQEWENHDIYIALMSEARRRGVTVVEVPNRHRQRPIPKLTRIQLSRVQWNTFDVALLVDAEDTIAQGDPFLKQHKVLAVDQDATAYGIDSVAYNDREVGAIAARHFHEMGHRRFAVTEEFSDPGFTWDPNWTTRRLGYEAAIGQFGGTIMPAWRLMVPHRSRRTLKEFLAPTVAGWAAASPAERPTAIFAPSASAIGPLLRELALFQMSVPRDISIVTIARNGFEQVENGMRITAVEVRLSNLVSRAFDVAAELAAEGTTAARTPRLIFAPALLSPGQSTAPPRD